MTWDVKQQNKQTKDCEGYHQLTKVAANKESERAKREHNKQTKTSLTQRKDYPCADPEGGGGGAGGKTPLKHHKNIGFLSKTGPDPVKITKDSKRAAYSSI